jgi:DNA repair protein RadD
MILRPYQEICIAKLREHLRAGQTRILLVLPCGAGKGTMATYMIEGATSRRKRVLFLVNRRTLVNDLSRRLDRLGLDHGVIMGDHWRKRPELPVQVASIDTLHRRERLPEADLLFLDEAHFSISPVWLKVVNRFIGVPLIGMTATPIRTSGAGLGSMYDVMVQGPTMQDLIGLGHLVPARVFAPTIPDVREVDVTAGEYNQKQLGEVMNQNRITGDIVAHWLKLAAGRPTVVFAVDVKHSQSITERFVAAGRRWKHVDANTPDDERERMWADLVSGELEGVSSVGVVSYGWDVPEVSCAILARPTASLALYIQQVGRVVRSAPGKSESIVLDHAGNTLRHGWVDEDREWTLEGQGVRPKTAAPALAVRMCEACWCAYRSSLPACPECGTVYKGKPRKVAEVDGSLEEFRKELKKKAVEEWRKKSTDDTKRGKFEALRRMAKEKGYKPGFAMVKFRAMFGHYPPKEWMAARGTVDVGLHGGMERGN